MQTYVPIIARAEVAKVLDFAMLSHTQMLSSTSRGEGDVASIVEIHEYVFCIRLFSINWHERRSEKDMWRGYNRRGNEGGGRLDLPINKTDRSLVPDASSIPKLGLHITGMYNFHDL
jgi:hypothetical protein